METSAANAPRFTREERADGRTPVPVNDVSFVPTPIADPGPLGLAAFALTTFVLSMYNADLVGVGGEPVVLGLAFAYGGLAQFVAGMWEFRTGNTFGAMAFTSYGAFWLSFAAFVTWFEKDIPKADVGHAVGLYLIAWGIFTLYMFVASLRTTAAIAAVFALLTLTFFALGIGNAGAHENIVHLGGWLGLATAAAAWYASFAGVTNSTFKRTVLPVKPLS
jgi:succinate-acetate transporter protein